ncbi:ATP-binding protein [Streptomyces roseoverticillatus]|uniref:ATP-binding protein n=1 Tax=Streptomyces roseoverticillatus TaxID=66429 RepID=A0ABV3J419_9ACTN
MVYGFLAPFLSLSLATVVFFCLTYSSVRRAIIRAARKDPRGMVPTAGPAIRDVVGREELCLVIARALRDKRTRRPYLLVGGVGAGKTSVLVQLTRMLAEKGAVPVPIRMRDIDMEASRLDFREVAMKRFGEMADRDVLSDRHSERVWRQLCMDDKAVVLADGLEETFADDEDQNQRDENQKQRDVRIRQAIERAGEQKLPLVIASRPHAPLEHTKAAVVDLEPLSEEAAREYLKEDHDCDRLDRVVEAAGAAESPLYLQIARELREHPRREPLTSTERWARLNASVGDRTESQRRLLDEWREALITGRIQGEVALAKGERTAVVELISALAGIGLLRDQLEVRIDDLRKQPEILARFLRRIDDGCGEEPDKQRQRELLALCATQGEQLGLIETRGEKVRFQHSILQAYLGSGYLDVKERALLAGALGKPVGPGRELLIGLGLNSRSEKPGSREFVGGLREDIKKLLKAAGHRKDVKALDMYAVALDIDRAAGAEDHRDIAERLRKQWASITAGDRRTIEEAKERLVHRFGEVLRAVACPAYEQFFTIATIEHSYQIRLAIAQEIGAGGDKAFDALRSMFPLPRKDEPGLDDPWSQYEKEVRDQSDAEHWTRENLVRRTGLPRDAYEKQAKKAAEEGGRRRLEIWRKFVMRAWLVPMMVGSVSSKHREQAKERLHLWLRHLEPVHSRPHGADLPISLETALAQGFQSAANRRPLHPQANDEAREFLVAQAEIMLAHARYWYSQMTLIQALCLWELPDRTGRAPDSESGSSQPVRKTDPTKAVRRWLALAGSKQDPRALHSGDRTRKGDRVHPFVAGAASLAVFALESGHPERFVWIDEIGTMNKIGSSPADPGVRRRHRLWIPPSVGWSTLHPRAQQLLADVFLLRNLTERDTQQPAELDACLERADRTDLPPCLVKQRCALRPGRTVGMAGDATPGSACRAESACRDCPFELCPYPAMGVQPRAEVREVFCRQQQALLRRYRWRSYFNPLSWTRKRAPWHGMTARELHRFWEAMAKRSRTPSD